MRCFAGFVLACLLLYGPVLPGAEQAKPVLLADLPAAAQKTVEQQIGKGKVTKIERRTEEGTVLFDVDFSRNGEQRTLSVGADGILHSIEVTLAETPAPVQKAIKEQLKDATLDIIEKAFDADEVTYEVEIKRGQLKRAFTVAPDGKVVRLQIDLAETPAAVQKAIAAQPGKVGNIFRLLENNQVSYDVEITKDGQPEEINIAENGHLECIKVTFADLPVPAQKAVTNRLRNGHIQRIDKCFDQNGDVVFEISAKKDGKRFDFMVGPKGRFLGMIK